MEGCRHEFSPTWRWKGRTGSVKLSSDRSHTLWCPCPPYHAFRLLLKLLVPVDSPDNSIGCCLNSKAKLTATARPFNLRPLICVNSVPTAELYHNSPVVIILITFYCEVYLTHCSITLYVKFRLILYYIRSMLHYLLVKFMFLALIISICPTYFVLLTLETWLRNMCLISYGHGSVATSHCLSLALTVTCPASSLELMSQADKHIAGRQQRAAILALSSGLHFALNIYS